MGQLTVTLSDKLEKEVRDKVREGQYGSVSDFVRDAITGALSFQPTYWERFIAVHVIENNKLLKTLADTDALRGDELLDALKSGYASQYYNAERIVVHGELPSDGIEFVQDVLEMYGELQRGVAASTANDKEFVKAVEFKGFDGNGGDGYLDFVNFLVDNGRFSYVKPLDKTPHLNSHSSVNGMYARMLDEYKLIKAGRKPYEYKPLSFEEVRRIIDAQTHPEFRGNK